MLQGQHADQLITLLTHELFVGPLPKVQDEVLTALSETLSDTEQVCVDVHVPDVLVALARLNYPIVSQDYVLRLGEEDHVFLLEKGREKNLLTLQDRLELRDLRHA